MEMRLNLDAVGPKQLSALISAMLAYGCLSPDGLADVVAPWVMPDTGKRAPIANGTLYADIPTHGLHGLIADLNAELYSRRVIKPEDNPASGVEAAALNSDAGGMIEQHIREVGLPASLVTPQAAAAMDETLDFASIFGAAKSDTETITLKFDSATADAIKANPDGAAQALATATQLDKNGLPWDSRIHAASKAINADGTWRQKRGVADALVTTVEAELRQVMSVTVPTDTAIVVHVEQGDPENEPLPNIAVTVQGAAIIPPPPPVTAPPAPPAPPAPAGDPTNFPELVTFIAAQKVAGKLTQEQVTATLKEIGIEGALPVIAARLDIIPALVAKLRAIGGV